MTPGRSFASANGRGLLFRLLEVEADDDTVPAVPEKVRDKKEKEVFGGLNFMLTAVPSSTYLISFCGHC